MSQLVERFAEFQRDSDVSKALASRNSDLSQFWLKDNQCRIRSQPDLAGLNTLIIDAEDTFTSMIQHQLRSLGLRVVVRHYDEPFDLDQFDLVILGPGQEIPKTSMMPASYR